MTTLRPPTNVILSQAQAHEVLVWLYGRSAVPAQGLSEMDRGFAQALLQDMLDRSFAIGFVEALVRSTAKIPQGPKKVIISFLKGAGKHMVKYRNKEDLAAMVQDPKVYRMVKDDTARQTRSAWAVREQTGDLTY